jgi:hypothetical protein
LLEEEEVDHGKSILLLHLVERVEDCLELVVQTALKLVVEEELN